MDKEFFLDRPTITAYKHNFRTLLAVDSIIFGFDNEELKLLIIKRDYEPELGSWSLMGGFMLEEETLEEAANRVLYNLTGLHDVYMEQIQVFSKPDRDPVERTVSVPFYSLINIEEHDKELLKHHSASWFPLKKVPKLIFDHNDIVNAAIKQLRYKTSIQPIGFELLPEKFTMRQLQKLYEAILDIELDKRNFSKKIRQLDILVKLDEKDMSSSKKGSFLYMFDKRKYKEKVADGFIFKL
ncbi:NUDIX domain-containing protein [Marinoscillum sp. MHG1-6]|uniref:NUDIX hydrolase n=1 Tax=Marinoscillum sp. MHG1-6 TaxID=2959627 RepID=UPI002157C010|nr:NUDIX domain-containing protein [Marinoscillum sp. MHG1-6]